MNVEGDPRAERPFKAEGRREKLFRSLFERAWAGGVGSREITIKLSRHPTPFFPFLLPIPRNTGRTEKCLSVFRERA